MRSQYKKTIFSVFLCFFVAVFLWGCGKEDKPANEIHIGYFNNLTHSQALLMKSEKTLEQKVGQDISVQWTAFNAGPAEVEALFAGDIDIGYIGPVPAVSANVKSRGDVSILAASSKGGAVLIKRKDSGINSVADLSGKVVAIPQIGNTQHLDLLRLLKENNLKPVTEGGTVTVSAVSNADVANMMERGDVDAALVPEPWGTILLQNGAELLLDYDQIYMQGESDVAVVVVRKDFMNTNPELVEKFLEAHKAATDKINNEKETSIKIINDELKSATGKSLEESVIVDAFERIRFSTELNRESVMGYAQISKEQGFIKELPAQESVFLR